MRLLNTAEAADYLRLKERKLYELVAEGAIPCTKITGRWLFPKDEIDRWLASGMIRPPGMASAEPMPIIGGSHDPLLEWALRESRSGLATLPEGSESGLARFRSGELLAAAIHLHDLSDAALDTNVEALRAPGLDDAVLIAFARREQGFIVAPGNPLGIATIHDILEKNVRMAMRPAGAGAQLLLRALLHRAKLAIENVNAIRPTAPTGSDIALAVRAKRADCGIATRSVANATGLDFVPIVWEHFDLMIRHRDYFRPAMQAFCAFLRTEGFAARAAEQGGYDITETGSVRFTR